MKNNFISPHNLPPFADFLKRREADIKSAINGLTLQDVQDDEMFEKTQFRVKNEILLKLVEFGDIEYVDCEYESKEEKESNEIVAHYIHQVVIPFIGDKALFSYVPEKGFAVSHKEEVVVIPFSGNLIIYVDLPVLNSESAISHARDLLNLTMQFVQSNNATVADWNKVITHKIEDKLKEKRDHLINSLHRRPLNPSQMMRRTG